ncbi:MAG: GNAT family N-acetyltransferase [Caldilineaceae bacterium]
MSLELSPPVSSSPPTLVTTQAHAASYTVLPYHADHAPLLLPLLQETLGNSGAVRKTGAFWQWKHAENPFGASSGLYAWDEAAAQAVGLRVLMRWAFQHPDGQIVQGARAVDTATHPAYQRMGIFSALTRQAIAELTAQGVDCIFNTPNQKSLPGYLKMGWQVAAQWPLYLKPLRPLRMAWRRLRPAITTPDAAFDRSFAPAILPWAEFHARYGDQLPALVAAHEQNRRHRGLRTVRTVDYLAWRYGGHPHVRYGLYPHTDRRGELLGLAILRPNLRYGWQEMVLAELCLRQPTVKHGVALLRHLRRHLRGDYLIAHAARPTLEYAMLRRSGFWPAPGQSITFTVRPLQPTAATLHRAAAWDLTLGDLEIF